MTGARQLPRGRHGLSREEVETDQRERMLRGMSEAVAERGYANTPVAEVLRHAGVSRETFYEHFANKEECFLAAFDFAAATVWDAMADSLGPPEGEMTEERVAAVFGRYLEVLAEERAAARTFLVDVFAAGPRAIERLDEIQGRFTAAVAYVLGARDERERFACEALVSAVSMLTTQRVAAGDWDGLLAMRDPFAELISAALDGRSRTAEAS